ncbi:exodeoxyribonuclease I [Oleiagrimonas soli]|uniref:Exodeoxyribonuclease I n=1 Tax=Oleiagrimonas soli TaxID=1543381 RepID=A0A099CYP6_9GAMM|nr:exodeoxyribonuclease I [Oleiagrimonas soli]KGI78145.1 exonuclease I [Oleiagrimonas soli]MBB6183404.1 exodeoxyribonuclease-1 [Oleiagrimonas soli]
MSEASFFWHDYETFGTDARRDRAVQFAGIRTTLDLEPIGDPVSLFCRPPRDALPQPEACLVTGITPQQAQREGVCEAEFASRVHEELAAPGTCGVGYNSLRFDDEFTRQMLYRNFYDPYAREWRNGNARWDLIDLARMCHALRPDGIVWPQRDDGAPSFKLEHLAAANGLEQRRAHDALSDVEALIAFARLIRTRQPRLWNWYFELRRKQRAFELLDLVRKPALLHVSSRYPAANGCMTMIVPLARHPSRSNEIIVYDLATNPVDLIVLDADDIADRVFTPRADLPEDVERIPLRTIHANRSPALAPLSVLDGVDTARIGLDAERCAVHRKELLAVHRIADKVREVFAVAADLPPPDDPELALYAGFLPDADRPLLDAVRATPPEQLGRDFGFGDPRYAELLFRYRARNWPHTLSTEERARWDDFRRQRVRGSHPLSTLSLTDYIDRLQRLRGERESAALPLLDQLEQWGRELATELDLDIKA